MQECSKKLAKFVPVALAVASLSKDSRRKVGALILGPGLEIRATGYNGFARGVDESMQERHEKPEKFFWTCHAEENAIVQAARSGVSTDGCTLLVTTLFPCATCARMIIQSGIRQIVAPKPEVQRPESRWLVEAQRSHEMFREAGVAVHFIEENEDDPYQGGDRHSQDPGSESSGEEGG